MLRKTHTNYAEPSSTSKLAHGWNRIKNLHFYSSLALSTNKNVKCYPTMTKKRLRTQLWRHSGALVEGLRGVLQQEPGSETGLGIRV